MKPKAVKTLHRGSMHIVASVTELNHLMGAWVLLHLGWGYSKSWTRYLVRFFDKQKNGFLNLDLQLNLNFYDMI